MKLSTGVTVGVIVWATAGIAWMSFIVWAIYSVVTHITGG